MKERQSVDTGTHWEALAGYARAVRVGPMICVSGTTATADDGSVVGGDGETQTRFVLAKIERALTQLGASLRDVMRTRIYVRDIADWEARRARAWRDIWRDPAGQHAGGRAAGRRRLSGRNRSRCVAAMSTQAMRFSLRFNNDLPARDYIALAQAAEQAGFDQFWVSNDLFLRSAQAILPAMAVATTRIEIGSCIFNPYTCIRPSSPCSPPRWMN